MPISTFKLIQYFSNQSEYDVHVILPAKGEFASSLIPFNVKCKIIHFFRLRSFSRPKALCQALSSAIPACLKLFLYLKKNRISLVHFSDIIDFPFYPAARFTGCKTITHLRICIENTALRVFFRGWTKLFIHQVICISKAVQSCFSSTGADVITVYNPGPDLSLFDVSRKFERPQTVNPHIPGVLAVGKFVEVKGHLNFVRMAAIVRATLPGKVHFYILGGKVEHHEKYWNTVITEIETAGMNGDITIIPPVANSLMPSVYASMKVFVHIPCWQEGLGGAVLEAMAMAVPVVAFNSGGLKECFTHGVSGFLVPHMDIKAAADKVVDLLKDESMIRRMGDSARQEVLEKFSYKKHFDSINGIYNRLV
jgi:glycosyltransferase involved in cell wall biosynthesis